MPVSEKAKKANEQYREALKEALKMLKEDEEELVKEIRKAAEESPFKYYYLGYTKASIRVEVRS